MDGRDPTLLMCVQVWTLASRTWPTSQKLNIAHSFRSGDELRIRKNRRCEVRVNFGRHEADSGEENPVLQITETIYGKVMGAMKIY